MTPLSILDLAPVPAGSSPAKALKNSLDLAMHAERWGYRRYWLAEHHNMTGIASAATSVVLAYIGSGTKSIRIGAGGVMLPNHAPLVIAEQFGTLESLFPGRIDLGVGRAPGTDQLTLRALRRSPQSAEAFPHDVVELLALLGPVEPGQAIQAIPGADTNVPVWILGSSLFGAHLAAALGLPFAFASHFAPDMLLDALEVYRSRFTPSQQLGEPYAMAGINVIAADTDSEARRLFTSAQQQFTNLLRGTRGRLQPPVADIEHYWTPQEKRKVEQMLTYSFVGAPETVFAGIERFLSAAKVNEIIAASAIFDHAARLRSYEILSGLKDRQS
jgi:luciferase family oxidoreductase group 1